MKIIAYKKNFILLTGVHLPLYVGHIKEQYKGKYIDKKKHKMGYIVEKKHYDDVILLLRQLGEKRIQSEYNTKKTTGTVNTKNVSIVKKSNFYRYFSKPPSDTEKKFYFSLYRQNPKSQMAQAFISNFKFTDKDMNPS
jgi:hypothetical protein